MIVYLYEVFKSCIVKTGTDVGLIARGSVEFAAGDDLTTEKKTSEIGLTASTMIHPNELFLLVIKRPSDATAGDCTVKVYNVVKTDGSNEDDALLTTVIIPNISGSSNILCFPVQGMFIGEGKVKLGVKFEADSGAVTVNYAIYRY